MLSRVCLKQQNMLTNARQFRIFPSAEFFSLRTESAHGQHRSMSSSFLHRWCWQAHSLNFSPAVKLESKALFDNSGVDVHSRPLHYVVHCSKESGFDLGPASAWTHGLSNLTMSRSMTLRAVKRKRVKAVEDVMEGVSAEVISEDLWIPDTENEGEQVELSTELELAELRAGTIQLGEYRVPLGKASLVVGVDPDLSGALAVLRLNSEEAVVEVMDVPVVHVKVGKRIRRRHDAVSIAEMLNKLDPPVGSVAYIEQATPFPKDGKQGWYSSGYSYGIWIGILAALGFTIIPVSACRWKRALGLAGCLSPKDESRILASSIFPSIASQLKRKKDHGRAEALLIAAWGHGVRNSCPLGQDPISSPR